MAGKTPGAGRVSPSMTVYIAKEEEMEEEEEEEEEEEDIIQEPLVSFIFHFVFPIFFFFR